MLVAIISYSTLLQLVLNLASIFQDSNGVETPNLREFDSRYTRERKGLHAACNHGLITILQSSMGRRVFYGKLLEWVLDVPVA